MELLNQKFKFGGANVKNFDLVSNLINQPWLIEKSWMEAIVDIVFSKNIDASTILTKEETSEAGTFYDYASKAYLTNDSTLVIPVVGPIFPRENFMTRYYTAVACDSIDSTIYKAEKDDRIEKVIFYFDSPGGYITGVNQTAMKIRDLGKTKETVSYIGGTCASAAYWFASQTGEIFGEETSRTGSVGVVVTYPKKDDQYYVEIVNDDSPNKRPDVSTDEGVSVIKSELNALAKVFISSVAKGRGITNKQVINDFKQGGVLVGKEAEKAGMIDGVSNFSELFTMKKDIKKKTKGANLMDVKTLKTDHPDIYQAIIDETKEDLSSLEEENASLKDQLEKKEETINTQGDRLSALEKKESLRTEQDISNKAHSIFLNSINGSGIPERLHAKVEKQVDYNTFVDNNVLDTEAYKTAVETEIEDWKGAFTANEDTSYVQGTSSSTTPDGDSNNGVENAADNMLEYLGIKED